MHWIWTLASVVTMQNVFTRLKPRGSEIYITFDDGPHPDHTPRLLAMLAEHDAHATFFVIGNKADARADVLRAIVAAGHTLGNHSYSHPRFDESSLRLQREEIDRTDEVLARIDGQSRHVMRPPHGRATLGAILICLSRRQRLGLWTHDSLDYRLQAPEVVERLKSLDVRPGDVILFHDDKQDSLDALGQLLPYWKSRGMVFAAL